MHQWCCGHGCAAAPCLQQAGLFLFKCCRSCQDSCSMQYYCCWQQQQHSGSAVGSATLSRLLEMRLLSCQPTCCAAVAMLGVLEQNVKMMPLLSVELAACFGTIKAILELVRHVSAVTVWQVVITCCGLVCRGPLANTTHCQGPAQIYTACCCCWFGAARRAASCGDLP